MILRIGVFQRKQYGVFPFHSSFTKTQVTEVIKLIIINRGSIDEP
jgi:hypothetical protein